MSDYLVTDTELTSVANAIRTKGGTSAPLVFPAGFVSAVNGIATFNPFGESLELLSTYPKTTTFLKDTAYSTWTHNTTSTRGLVNYATAETIAIDTAQYEYLIKFISDADIHYVAGTTLKAAPVRQVVVRYYYVTRRWSNLANLSAGTDNYNYASLIYSPYAYDYYDSGGSHTLFSGSFDNYGFFVYTQSQNFSSSTSTTPNLTVRFPSICMKCDANRFSTTMANAVDVDASSVSYWGFLYRCKTGSFARAVWDDVAAIYNGQGTGV